MSAEAHYRQLLDLSQHMLAAGKAQDWDELVRLEEQRRALLYIPFVAIPGESSRQAIELIHQIQACDAELREKVETWMAHTRILLRLDTPPSPGP